MYKHLDERAQEDGPRTQYRERVEDATGSAQRPRRVADIRSPVLGTPALLALQWSAGNRAVAHLMRTKSPLQPVQRCGCGAPSGSCGQQNDDATAAPQDIEEVAEEPLLAPQGVVQRTVSGFSNRVPSVQRAATFGAGSVHEVNNLARCVVVDETPAGVTKAVLNGALMSSGADVRAALVAPTVVTAAVASGGFDAQVGTVPTNLGSFDETVLAPGPWRHATTKAVFASLHPGVAGCGGAGASTFRAYGAPSDAAMFAANRRHEDRHARDFRDAFNTTIVPWDSKITAAKAAGTKFYGAAAADAEAALWAAMGGTPDQIATAFIDLLVAAIAAYHDTPAGGPVTPTGDAGARAKCTISWAYYRNPS